MRLRTLLIYNAAVTFPFGIGLVAAPTSLISLYGATLSPAGAVVAQLFGSALIFVGLLCWFARKASESEALRAIVLASFLESTLGFIVALLAQLSGVLNVLGWSNVALYLSLALGYGYFQLVKKSLS